MSGQQWRVNTSHVNYRVTHKAVLADKVDHREPKRSQQTNFTVASYLDSFVDKCDRDVAIKLMTVSDITKPPTVHGSNLCIF